MEKHILAVSQNATRSTAVQPQKTAYSSSFASALNESEKSIALNGKSVDDRRILVGEISRGRQTVSELLMHNRQFKNDTWQILSAPSNQGKDYTRLQAGTKIYFNPADSSLSWPAAGESVSSTASGETRAEQAWQQLSPPSAPLDVVKPVATHAPVALGVISKNEPTVSHLLKSSREFSNDTWKILASGVNKEKNFNQIPLGARVTIDPATQEISWQSGTKAVGNEHLVQGNGAVPSHSQQQVPQAAVAQTTPQPLQQPIEKIAAVPLKKMAENQNFTGQAGDLTEAVRPYFGKQYKDINCYELLVKGLERMNIPYNGKDGLFTKLTRMAKEHGLPENAYLNGEGVVKAAGSLVLSKSYSQTANWRGEADRLYKEMEPLLDRGQVLSFSTRRRGHTGIVSRSDDQWTFINSGRLDNSLTSGVPRKGVGEESLREEIHNWFKLANKSRESLSVTLGALTPSRVLTAKNSAMDTEASASTRI